MPRNKLQRMLETGDRKQRSAGKKRSSKDSSRQRAVKDVNFIAACHAENSL